MKPHILLFVCDDLRHDALGFAGNPDVYTPHLDQLSRDGTHFSRCYIPGGSNGAVCMPSRAMIHTGRSVFQLLGEGQEIASDQVMMGEYFGQQGYDTFHTGKWHNERESFHRSFADGDHIFFGGMGDQWAMPVQGYDPQGVYDQAMPAKGVHATDLFVDAACGFVKEHESEQPFFLSVALTAPHDPRNAPDEFHAMYDAEKLPLPENFLAMHPHHTGHLSSFSEEGTRTSGARDEDLASLPRRPAEVKKHLADYYAMISHLDDAFGRLRAAMEAKGVWENTLVVFTADHGLAVGQHGLMGKQNLYDHSLRVPLILCGPGVPVDVSSEELVCHYDVYGSLCELTNLPVPDSVHSASLPKIWEGEKGRQEQYISYERSIRGLISEGWKLIEYAGPDGYRASQLFDLMSDPQEKYDRIHDPAQKYRIQKLRERMFVLRESTGDADHRTGKVFWDQLDLHTFVKN